MKIPSAIYEKILRPVLFRLDPETAREMAMSALALAMAVCAAIPLHAADEKALASRQLPGVEMSPKNYGEMAANIERASGLKVKIDPELEALMRKFSFNTASSSLQKADGKTISLGQFLDVETKTPGLQWEIDANAGTVSLRPIWQVSDPRSAAELLKALSAANTEAQKISLDKNVANFIQWRDARKPAGALLDALISKKENYDMAWKVRMTGWFVPFSLEHIAGDETRDICVAADFAGIDGRVGVLVVIRHQQAMSPGEGGFEYYYFTPEGKLTCADLLSGGWRMTIDSITVDAGKSGDKSELLLRSGKLLQKFVMKPGRLSLEQAAMDDSGLMTARQLDGTRIGASIMDEALKPREEEKK